MSALERVRALLEQAPGLQRASHLAPTYLPVHDAFAPLLPGLRPGSTIGVSGIGATSLALALVARASADSFTAIAGLPSLNLVSASELGVAIDRVVVVSEATVDALAAVADAFDLVIARAALAPRDARNLQARVRERDAVLVTIGQLADSDMRLQTTNAVWDGLDAGHGYLRARRLTITAVGRGIGAHAKTTTLWLPDDEGGVSVATDVIELRRTS
jgi:hypothetical protein